jgi:Tfp pilus assembly protein PilF
VRTWLEQRDRSRRFFLWVHLWDPHGPYEPPPPFDRVAPDHPYLGEVAAADHGVGELVAALQDTDCWEDTLVVVVADHGESFFEHGEFSHGALCQDTTMHVPFLVRYPDGYRAGEREDAVASVVDVAPTLAAALRLAPLGGVDGEDLFRRSVEPGRGAYLESFHGFLAYGWSPLAGWVDERGKYLHSSTPMFYSPRDDPDETGEPAGQRADLQAYREKIALVADRPALSSGEESVDHEDLREKIRALGYAGFGQDGDELPHPLAPSELPSPRTRMEEHRLGLDAMGLANAGQYAEAEALHRKILESNPRNYTSLERLSTCLIRQERFLEAIPFLERVIDAGRASASSYVNLGICMRKAGNLPRATELCEQALRMDANQVSALGNLIDLYRATGRAAEAAPLLERFEALTGARTSDSGH